MPRMRRTTMLAFVVLGAAFAALAFSSTAGRLADDPAPALPSVAAGPQSVQLDWRETYGSGGERIVLAANLDGQPVAERVEELFLLLPFSPPGVAVHFQKLVQGVGRKIEAVEIQSVGRRHVTQRSLDAFALSANPVQNPH